MEFWLAVASVKKDKCSSRNMQICLALIGGEASGWVMMELNMQHGQH